MSLYASQKTLLPNDEFFAEIIIPLYLPKNYTWSIPAHLVAKTIPGIRVEVILRNKKYTGIVQRIFREKPESFNPHPILSIIDDEPILHAPQLQLWQWIADYYMCTEGEVMQAAVPSNFKLSSESILIWNDVFDEEDLTFLDNEEYIVAEALSIKKELKLSEVQKILDASHVYPIIKKLIDKKICFIWEELKQKYKPKTDTYIILHPDYAQEEKIEQLLNGMTRAPKQMELLLAYMHILKVEGEVTQANLLKKAGASYAQLKGLVDKKILLAEKRIVDRLPRLTEAKAVHITLSPAQEKAFQEMKKAFEHFPVCLLHGVTSSGKTELYIQLIDSYLASGKQILYMLPEIALTAQIINRLRKHFGNSIAIYHSKFNPNERVEIWNKIKTGETKIVLGARSALLLPFKDLGLIIVDEEHDPSYKQQEPAPRYHARDTAIRYAQFFHAHVLLGSATPSLETYYNCQQKKYGLVTLSERYGHVQMPNIELIDLKLFPTEKEELLILTPPLKEKITEVLAQKKQIILFQNRRGYTPFLQCATCGWHPECKNCNVSLTWHKYKKKLTCHYCGTEYPTIHTCPACGGHHFIQKNYGTEQIEEIIDATFPHAKTARMDLDSIKGKHDHETLIQLFEQRKIDILIGTQMVVKGLDFEHVQLVGIMDADSMLNFADFRVNERAFQLMEQVSGRAGRREGRGEVIIQVRDTTHPILEFVKAHDYQRFYQFELASRQAFFYPPFSRVIRLVVKHRDREIAEQAAILLVQGIAPTYLSYISGPAEPLINRIRNQYIWEIMLKLPKDAPTIAHCKKMIEDFIGRINADKKYRSVIILPDVDPA